MIEMIPAIIIIGVVLYLLDRHDRAKRKLEPAPVAPVEAPPVPSDWDLQQGEYKRHRDAKERERLEQEQRFREHGRTPAEALFYMRHRLGKRLGVTSSAITGGHSLAGISISDVKAFNRKRGRPKKAVASPNLFSALAADTAARKQART